MAITSVALSAYGQTGTPAGQINQSKLAVLVTEAFTDEPGGITKLINAEKALAAEFKPANDKLVTLKSRIDALSVELDNLRKNSNTPAATIQAKVDEGQTLQRQFDYEQKDASSRYSKRRSEIVGPVTSDIGKAIDEFRDKKGLYMIFNYTKFWDSGILVTASQVVDITKEFIQFYNTRPTPAPSAAKPATPARPAATPGRP